MKTKQIKLSELFYYLFFLLLLFAKGIGFYDGQPAFKLLLVLAVVMWIGKMCLTLYTKREIIYVTGLLGLGALTYLVSGEKGAFLYILMITALKGIPQKKLFQVGLAGWAFSFGILTWANALHLVEGPFKVHEKYGMGMVIRWGLGYSHPNVLHISYLVLVMFIVCVFQARYNWKLALGLMAGNILIFVYSLSSTGVIVVTAFLALSLYWMRRRRMGRAEMLLVRLVLPVFLIYSLLAPVLLSGKAFDFVNDLTNTRLNLAKYFLTLQLPTLFGTRVADIVTDKLTMDNSYVFAFVTYGMVLFAVIVIAYFLLIRRLCKEQRGMELCVILCSLFAGLTEPFLFNTSFKNISLLYMQELLFEGRSEKTVFGWKSLSERKISVPYISLNHEAIHFQWQKRKKQIMLIALLGCFAGAGIYQGVKTDPERIVVPKAECDVWGEVETVFRDRSSWGSEELVLGYVDENTEMMVYSGNIVRLEHFRGFIIWGLSVGTLFGGSAFIFAAIFGIVRNEQMK